MRDRVMPRMGYARLARRVLALLAIAAAGQAIGASSTLAADDGGGVTLALARGGSGITSFGAGAYEPPDSDACVEAQRAVRKAKKKLERADGRRAKKKAKKRLRRAKEQKQSACG